MKTTCALWCAGAVLLSVLCSARPHASFFDRRERQLIGSGDSLMRVWQTTDNSDSLFLRSLSRPLSRRAVRSPWFGTLKKRMLCTVCDTARPGVGIAAPQVGIGHALIAVKRFDKPGRPFEFYINPRLVYMSEQRQTGPEGCLSIPGRRGMVSRSTEVVVRYLDETTLKERQDTVSGYTAVIFQHEIDHLSGILYIDKLTD